MLPHSFRLRRTLSLLVNGALLSGLFFSCSDSYFLRLLDRVRVSTRVNFARKFQQHSLSQTPEMSLVLWSSQNITLRQPRLNEQSQSQQQQQQIYARHCTKHPLSFTSFFDTEIQVGTIITYMVHMRKQSLGRLRNLSKSLLVSNEV